MTSAESLVNQILTDLAEILDNQARALRDLAQELEARACQLRAMTDELQRQEKPRVN